MESDQNTFPSQSRLGSVSNGLSVRDYIAIKAMQGILSDQGSVSKMTANIAYEMADHMIEASNEPRRRIVD